MLETGPIDASPSAPLRAYLDEELPRSERGHRVYERAAVDELVVILAERPDAARHELAEILGISYNGVIDRLKRAMAAGWVAARKVPAPGRRSVLRYRLTMPAAAA